MSSERPGDGVLVEVHQNIGRDGVIVELRPEEHDVPTERDMEHLSMSEARDLFEKLRQVLDEDASILGPCENCEMLLREGENVELPTGTYCEGCAELRDEEPLVTDGGTKQKRYWACPDCGFKIDRHHAEKERPFCDECEFRDAVLIEMKPRGPGKEKFREHGGER